MIDINDNLIPIVDFEDEILTTDSADDLMVAEGSDNPNNEPDLDIGGSSTNISDTNTNSDNNVSTLFYNKLVEEGIADEVKDKSEYTWEDIDSTIQNYKNNLPDQIAQTLINQLPEEAQDLIDYVLNKPNLTKEDLSSFYQEYLEDASSMNVNDDESARKVLYKEYSKSFRKSAVEAMLDALEDDGELINEAKKLQPKYKEKLNSLKESNKESKLRQEQFATDLNKEFSESTWSNSKVRQLKKDLFTGRTNEILNDIKGSPKAIIQLADFATYYNAETKSFDFDKFVQKAQQKDVKTFRQRIEEELSGSGSSTKSIRIKNKSYSIDDLIPIK